MPHKSKSQREDAYNVDALQNFSLSQLKTTMGSRRYPQFRLVAVSRTAFENAINYHDANYLTFHRIAMMNPIALPKAYVIGTKTLRNKAMASKVSTFSRGSPMVASW